MGCYGSARAEFFSLNYGTPSIRSGHQDIINYALYFNDAVV
jgi:hypothetical protein